MRVQGCTGTEERPCEDTERRHPSAAEERASGETSPVLTLATYVIRLEGYRDEHGLWAKGPCIHEASHIFW